MSFQLDRAQGSSLREDGVPPEDSIKSEAEELTTNTPREGLEVIVKEEDVKEEEVDSVPSRTEALTTINYMYKPDEATTETQPKNPHTTRFPNFPHIPNRIAPHPLDRTSWFKPELSLPPPSHLHTLDDGNSLFDVNFARQSKTAKTSDIGGTGQAAVQERPRLLCYTGWNAPFDHVGQGGPYCVVAPVRWSTNWDSLREVERLGTLAGHVEMIAGWEGSRHKKQGKSAPARHDGSMSFFCGGGEGHRHTWRYRGDIKMDEQVEIGPEQFSKMGGEEKSQWINYFRFENVVSRLTGGKRSPNQFFKYLSTPGSPKLTFTTLKIVGYDENRIGDWLETRRKRLNPSRARSIAPPPAAQEQKPKTQARREKSSGPISAVEEGKRVTRSSSRKSSGLESIGVEEEASSDVQEEEDLSTDVEDEKPIPQARPAISSGSQPYVDVPERKPLKRIKREV